MDPAEVAARREAAEQDDAEQFIMRAAIGTVFDTKKPRDVVAGTSSGLKTVTKSIGLGLASLVAYSYMGAKQSGTKGLVKGVGVGMATCTASVVAGTAVGTAQITRGVLNTPRAVVSAARGRVWNVEKRRWEVDWYSLPEEAAEVLGETEGAEGGEAAGSDAGAARHRRPGRQVQDTALYDILDCTPDATAAELRKAFYKKSLKYHPDKNPDDPEATKNFQAVSNAYRVLGDEERRRIYDEHGSGSALDGMQKIDPAVFFAALFGSHHFEPFIGRLWLAQEVDGDLASLLHDAAMGDETGPSLDMLKVKRAHDRVKRVQREREVRLAVQLAGNLQPLVGPPDADEATSAEWEAKYTEEVNKLAQVACGAEMLFLIGWVYANRARQYMAGGMVKRAVAKMEAKTHIAKSKVKLARAVGSTYSAVNGIMKKHDKKCKEQRLKEEKEAKEAKEGKSAAEAAAAATAAAAAPEAEEPAGDAGEGGAGAAADSEINSEAESGTPSAGAAASSASRPAAAAAAAAAPAGPSAGAAPASGAGQQAQAETDELTLGMIVMVQGLRQQPELNDELGVIVGFDSSTGRYHVQMLTQDGDLKSLKRANLVMMDNVGESSFTAGFDDASEPEGAPTGEAGGPSGDAGEPGEGKPTGDQWVPGWDDTDFEDALKMNMTVFHDTLWDATKLDIEYTLGAVTKKVLRDMSIDKSRRQLRARSLHRLGRILQQPMLEQRQQAKRKSSSASTADSSTATPRAGGEGGSRPGAPLLSATDDLSESSHQKHGAGGLLARFKPKFPHLRRSPADSTRDKQRAEAEDKKKRLEDAMSMMAAGVTIEDVDALVAARAAMDKQEPQW